MIILKEDTTIINNIDKSSILNNIKPDIDSSLSAMSDFLSSQIISDELRIYYDKKSIINIRVTYDEEDYGFVIEDYQNNITICDESELIDDVEDMIIDLNFYSSERLQEYTHLYRWRDELQ